MSMDSNGEREEIQWYITPGNSPVFLYHTHAQLKLHIANADPWMFLSELVFGTSPTTTGDM